MKKITKILTSMFTFVLVLAGAVCLTACTKNKDEKPLKDEKELCTVSYNLNFKNTDYYVLKDCMDNGLSFDVDGFVEQSNVLEPENVNIVYTRQIELGRGFILYKFKDKVLSNYFEGWYTSSGVCVDELNSTVKNDITLYAKWKEDLKSLTVSNGKNCEYKFNESNLTASFMNGSSNSAHNDVDQIILPELVFNNGKFYVVNDISYNSSREHMVFYVPKTYTGSINYPIIFPNEDQNDFQITYLGNYISQQIGSVICIYEANYDTNTLKLKHLERGSVVSNYPYLTLGEDVVLCRNGESERTLKIVDFCLIYPGRDFQYKKFIISKDANVEFPEFSDVLQNNNNEPIDVFFELTKDEVNQIDLNWIETDHLNRPAEEIYYYSETQPTDDGYNYWHYVNGEVVIW